MAYYGGFDGLIYSLQSWGVFEVLLPFILIFTIVFAVMEKTKVLGSNEHQTRKYGSVIALVVALSVLFSHFFGVVFFNGRTIVQIINESLAGVGLLLVAIVMMLLTIGLWTGKTPDGSKGVGVWFTLISGLVVLGIFLASMGTFRNASWVWRILNSDIMPLVVAILVFGLIIKFISSPEKKVEDKKSAAKGLKEFFESNQNNIK
ncbi:hypothetical protein K9M74_03425 [Candidatus Woesearchaeota archaeon]|nr:hypothetical protein [Candidatus Woesearchaeota archaeon]